MLLICPLIRSFSAFDLVFVFKNCPLIFANVGVMLLCNTQSFAEDIKNIQPLQEDEEDISYDVESSFTNIPINETIDYILDQIYNKKKLKPICSKLIFKRLLLKLATEVTFTINNNFFKQTDGCTMGGPLSVTFSDIFMIKMENDIVIPMKPIFYRRHVEDIYSRRKKNIEDSLFKA